MSAVHPYSLVNLSANLSIWVCAPASVSHCFNCGALEYILTFNYSSCLSLLSKMVVLSNFLSKVIHRGHKYKKTQ